jgi:molybdopterin synthase sulfur carrier subunit
MKVNIKFFASMRESMGRADDSIDVADGATVADVWAQVSSEALPENTLIAVNMEYTNLEEQLKEGDEVAFFPPVTGG